jgi:hypothetical protein
MITADSAIVPIAIGKETHKQHNDQLRSFSTNLTVVSQPAACPPTAQPARLRPNR